MKSEISSVLKILVKDRKKYEDYLTKEGMISLKSQIHFMFQKYQGNAMKEEFLSEFE
jgi:hypothetical protein